MRTNGECDFFHVCGAAIAQQRRAEQDFLLDDPRRNYILAVCRADNQERYDNCVHYGIRAELLGRREEDGNND